ncbi:response regulator [Enterobacter bugandensis]|uniref:response regulator n=2 Tax=Enterobacter bugandensis TaxID=881260 RepID=UPI002FCF3E52
MRKILFALLLTLIAVSGRAEGVQQLKLHGRQSAPYPEIMISDTDWRWLGQKRLVTIATWNRENPPLDIVLDSGDYEGIAADYLKIITGTLGLRCQILRFPSRDAALKALALGEADIVVDDPGTRSELPQILSGSRSYLNNRPALIRKESPDLHIKSGVPFSLAVPEGYLTDEQIRGLFPRARIVRFADNAAALAAAAYQKTDATLGNLTSVSFLIERNFNNDLIIDSISPQTGSGGRFITRRDDTSLLNGIDAVIDALPVQLHEAIINDWFLAPDFRWLHQPMALTAREKEWIKAHPVVDVVASPLYAPLTIQDKDGNFHGISRDVLHLISLRTGLQFRFRVENDVRDMLEDVQQKDASMLAAITWSKSRARSIVLTRPYLFTTYVFVVADKPGSEGIIGPRTRIAVASGNAIAEELKAKYPGITILSVANTEVAMKMVEEGRADAAVHNQIGAEYLIQRYFPGRLKIAGYMGEKRAELSFGLSRQERELESILNKSLADIPPRALAKIVNKWQGTPDIQLETWRNFSVWHYIAFSLSGLIIAGTLAWAFTLRRSVKTRQRAQKALTEELAFREILLNGSPGPIYVLDEQGQVISHNRAWKQFFDDVDYAIITLPLYDLRHPLNPALPALVPLFSLPEGSVTDVYRKRCTISDGQQAHTIIHWAALMPEQAGKRRSLVCGWEDITEHEALLTVISEEKARAEQASREKGHFLATMSHEIRTPVSAIIGLLELAGSVRSQNTPDGEAVRLAYASAQSLLDLIGDVLDLAKVEAGSLELAPDWVSPAQIARQSLNTFDGLARQKGLNLIFDDRLEAGYEYWLDAQRLRQVIHNVVSNSVKFTHTGNVGIMLTEILTAEGKIELNVEVYDTGIGISAEDQPKLFRPYSQLEEGKLQNGTGLGLAISAELIKLMSGTVSLASAPFEGTRINIMLPAARRRTATTTSVPEKHSLPVGVCRELDILIVDDHETNRLILRRQLERLGCRVTEAADGEEALLFLEDQSFDLIITDCQMPGMDGLALTQKVRSEYPELHIWGLTANAQPSERLRCITAGMNDCFFKPLLYADLKAKLQATFPASRNTEMPLQLSQLTDFERLREITGDSHEQLQALLGRALENNREDSVKLAYAVQDGNHKVAASVIHRMIGSADVIGAVSLGNTMRMMDSLLKANAGQKDLEDALAQIVHVLDAMDSAYKEFFKA